MAGLLLAVHLAAINLYPIGWFGDDLLYVEFAATHAEATPAQVLTYQDQALRRYRPLSKLLVLASYRASGLGTRWTHLASSASLALTVVAAVALGRRLRLPWSAVGLGLAWFLVHQGTILVLYRNARIEQHFTLWGLVGLGCVEACGAARGRRAAVAAATGAVLALSAALLWSEAAVAWLGVAALWALSRLERRRAFGLVALMLAMLAGYLAWSALLGAPLQDQGRYAVGLGRSTLVNLATAAAGWIEPVCTVRVLEWMRDAGGHAAALAASAAAALAVAGLLACALVHARRRQREAFRTTALLFGSALLCLFPAVLTQHVSEAYLYPSILFFCLGAGTVVEAFPRRSVTAAVLALVFCGHAEAAIHKVRLLHANGRRFERLVRELEAKTDPAPGRSIALVDQTPDPHAISQFVLPMPLLYLTGPQRGYTVVWRRPGSSGAWGVAPDGSLGASAP
ncbi:MAG TPA: hypothetical protein VJS92_05360 [Candidatus Polarisedimenticolaceae bacterium]|nr:hypothetical protein [Candidatus Polarisedimenticolaceae bacterium]